LAERLEKSLALQKGEGHAFHADPYVLRAIQVREVHRWGDDNKIGYMLINPIVNNADGYDISTGIFLRGSSVAMLAILIPDDVPTDSSERYVVLTTQPRLAAGSTGFIELPAGMVDEADGGCFKGAAMREIKEELDIHVEKDELQCLNDLAAEASGEKQGEGDGEDLPQGVFPSVGGCDEYIKIYMFERRIPRAKLTKWNGKCTGVLSEGERIKLKIVLMQDAWKVCARDAKCLSALALYEGLKRDGKIKSPNHFLPLI
jgi:8-oxo-dGTP pyrophosphatase MutT (NUDIX family)